MSWRDVPERRRRRGASRRGPEREIAKAERVRRIDWHRPNSTLRSARMPWRSRKLVALFVLLCFATLTASASAAGRASGFRALSGVEASRFSVPADMRIVERFPLLGLRYERYQQF